MLTNKNRQDIYSLLLGEYKKGQPILLKDFRNFLKKNGLAYQEFGYSKIESLIDDLKEFLTLSNSIDEQGHKIKIVKIHDYEEIKDYDNRLKREKLQKKVQSVLLKEGHYEFNKEYPLASISKTLFDNGIDFHDYGFSKMKSMLSSLNNIKIREVEQNGVKQPLITLLGEDKGVKEVKKKTPEKKVVENKKTVENKKIIENKKDIYDFYIPPKLILSVKEMAALGLDDHSIVETIQNDYARAIHDETIEKREEGLVFPLSFSNKNDENMIGAIKRADAGNAYEYYLNYVGTDKERPKDLMKREVYFNDYDEALKDLKDLAREESWCYKHSRDPLLILKIYLQYTYHRLFVQKKIFVDPISGFVAFNTGLVDDHYEAIFALLMVNKDETIKNKYIFQGFTIAGTQGLGKVLVEHFNPLPEKATYFESFDEFVPKFIGDVPHTDYQHIIHDNLDRFPLDFLDRISTPFNYEHKLVLQLIEEKSDFQRGRLFHQLVACLDKNQLFYSLIRTSLEMAINKGVRMIKYDFRKALPSFFPTRNVLSILLPLSFDEDDDKVQAALLIEKMPSGNYQGQTILTLKQCYVNSRIISSLDSTYLNASEIED